MTTIVEVPGYGEVEFPDNMSDEEIAVAIRKNIMLPKTSAKPAWETAKPTDDMSGLQRFAAGAGKALTDLYRGARQLAVGDNQADIDEAKRLDAPLMGTGAGMAGNIAGGMTATLPAIGIPGVNTLVGSAALGGGLGALTPTASDESRTTNASYGALGGSLGYGAGKLLGSLITPVNSTLTKGQERALASGKEVGAKITPGGTTGSSALRGLETGMESFPITSEPMKAIRHMNEKAMSRAAAKAIGEQADEITGDVLSAAHKRLGAEFDKVQNISAIQVGAPVQNKLASIEMKYRGMLDRPLVEHPIVKDIYDALGSDITGAQYHDWQSQLGKIIRSKFAGEKKDPSLGFALAEVKNALDDAAAAVMSKAEKSAFKTAQQQWRNLVILESGNVTNEASGKVSGRLLANALSRKDLHGFRLGGDASDMYKMARFYKAFPEFVGDSGTATRIFLPWLIGTAGASGLGAGAVSGDVGTGAAGALTPLALAALLRGGQGAYLSGPGQAYLTNQLLSPSMKQAISGVGVLAGSNAAGILR